MRIHLPWRKSKPKIVTRALTLAEFEQVDKTCNECGGTLKPTRLQRVDGSVLFVFCTNCGTTFGMSYDEVLPLPSAPTASHVQAALREEG